MKESKRAKDLETIVIVTTILLLFSFIFKKDIFILVSFTLLVISSISKKLTSMFSDQWLRFSRIISTVNSKAIISVVFFLFLLPIATIYKLFNKNPLQIKRDKATPSYFYIRNHSFIKEDFEKMW